MIDNPYWNDVEPQVSNRSWLDGGRVVAYPFMMTLSIRMNLVGEYSYTVTAPDTLDFVRRHCTKRVLDPMAGTGYWAYLLGQVGIEVIATDLNPPEVGEVQNIWHMNAQTHVPVKRDNAVDAMIISEPEDTLLLSWPPASEIATLTLQAFRGNRLIYIGEWGSSCASTSFFTLLEAGWRLSEEHVPVRYEMLHDVVTVWERTRQPRSTI